MLLAIYWNKSMFKWIIERVSQELKNVKDEIYNM